MTLQEILVIAEQIKPIFDKKIQQLAYSVQGSAILPPLKSIERARAKIIADYNGDATMIRDILRASIIVDSTRQVNEAYNAASNYFSVIKEGSRNGYTGTVHSSDGYFDAKLDIAIAGIYAEIQIHTQAMIVAKEKVHFLYQQRQAIIRSVEKGVRPTAEQKKEIDKLNSQMRQIYREVSHE
jgi:hypothetical protein